MTGAVLWLRLVEGGSLGEGRLDLDLRGWAEGTRKMLAFQLVLRGSSVREFKGGY